MYKKTLLSALVATAMIGGASVSLVYAVENEQEPVEKVEQVEAPDAAEVSDGRKFDDPERLETTLVEWQDELAEDKTAAAEQDLADAEQALADAPDDISDEDKQLLQDDIDAANDAIAGIALEQEKIAALIAGEPILDENGDPLLGENGEPLVLTEEQIFALNRSLNNATNNGLIVDLDSAYLEKVISGEYSKQQINSLTKALEEEAKFGKLSDMFTSKYDATGNEKFLDKADMMSTKGEKQKDKFLAKVDKFGSGDELEYQNKMKKSSRDTAKGSAKNSAKSKSKDVAKSKSKDVAKSKSKDVAKSNAKNTAKERAKENARDKVKSNNGKKA